MYEQKGREFHASCQEESSLPSRSATTSALVGFLSIHHRFVTMRRHSHPYCPVIYKCLFTSSFQSHVLVHTSLTSPCVISVGKPLRLCSRCPLHHAFRITDTVRDALLHTLESQRRNQRRTDTRAVLSGQDLDWVVTAAESLPIPTGFPVEDLLKSLRAASLVRMVSDRSYASQDWWIRTLK